MTENELLKKDRQRQAWEGISPNERLFQKLERISRLHLKHKPETPESKLKTRREYKRLWRARRKEQLKKGDR